jgi:hemerythrin superfamily protein
MSNRLDEMMAHGMGKAHGFKARIDGLLGVFKTLAEQHGEAGALLKKVKADPDKRADLWPTIKEALTAHEQGELRAVYPAMREYAELAPLADQHDGEASELTAMIQRLDATNIKSPQWTSLFDQLVDMVMAHVDEEEGSIFPQAQAIMGDARAKELQPKFLAAHKQMMHKH